MRGGGRGGGRGEEGREGEERGREEIEGKEGGEGEGGRKEVRERRGERKGHIKIIPLYRRVRMVATHFDCCFTCSTSSSTTLCSVQIRSIGAERVS